MCILTARLPHTMPLTKEILRLGLNNFQSVRINQCLCIKHNGIKFNAYFQYLQIFA